MAAGDQTVLPTIQLAQRLRAARQVYPQVRDRYLRGLAADAEACAAMGLEGLWRPWLESGLAPPGFVVHYRVPLHHGGTVEADNLVLVRADPDHDRLHGEQADEVVVVGGGAEGWRRIGQTVAQIQANRPPQPEVVAAKPVMIAVAPKADTKVSKLKKAVKVAFRAVRHVRRKETRIVRVLTGRVGAGALKLTARVHRTAVKTRSRLKTARRNPPSRMLFDRLR